MKKLMVILLVLMMLVPVNALADDIRGLGDLIVYGSIVVGVVTAGVVTYFIYKSDDDDDSKTTTDKQAMPVDDIEQSWAPSISLTPIPDGGVYGSLHWQF